MRSSGRARSARNRWRGRSGGSSRAGRRGDGERTGRTGPEDGGGERTGGAERIGEAGGRRRPCGKTRLKRWSRLRPVAIGQGSADAQQGAGPCPPSRELAERHGRRRRDAGRARPGCGPPAGRSGSGRGGGRGGRQRHGPPCHLVRLTDLADRRDPGRLAAGRPLLAQRGEPAGWTGRGGRRRRGQCLRLPPGDRRRGMDLQGRRPHQLESVCGRPHGGKQPRHGLHRRG